MQYEVDGQALQGKPDHFQFAKQPRGSASIPQLPSGQTSKRASLGPLEKSFKIQSQEDDELLIHRLRRMLMRSVSRVKQMLMLPFN